MPPTHLFPPLSRRLSTCPTPLDCRFRPPRPPHAPPRHTASPQLRASPLSFKVWSRATRSTKARERRRASARPIGAQARGGGVRSSRSSSPSRHRLSLPSPVIAGSGKSRLLLPTVLPPTPPQHVAKGERENYHCESGTTSTRLRHIITQREAPSCGLTKSSRGARPKERRRKEVKEHVPHKDVVALRWPLGNTSSSKRYGI